MPWSVPCLDEELALQELEEAARLDRIDALRFKFEERMAMAASTREKGVSWSPEDSTLGDIEMTSPPPAL